MKSHLILALVLSSCLCLCSGCSDSGGMPEFGSAPPLGLQKILQAPEGAWADWQALKGNVVVLEFWATWCGPCVAAIPHLNELAEKFADKPVRFIAITDEDEATIKPYLKKKHLQAWVGLDENRATFNAYGVSGIPRTFLVDRKGRVVADTYPTEITEKVLTDLLAGRRPSVPRFHEGKGTVAGVAPDDELQTPPLYQVLIKVSDKEYGSTSRNNGNLTAEGITVRQALSIAYDVRPTRIVETVPLPQERYTIVVAPPAQRPELSQPLLQEALANTFGLTVSRSMRETDVLLLTAPQGATAGLQASAPASGMGTQGAPGFMSAAGASITTLACHIEDVLNQPVVDETGLTGRFDFELKWDADHPESLPDALRQQLGLELMPATRPIEVLVVDARAE